MKSILFTQIGSVLGIRFSRKVWLAICLTGALSLWWGTPAAARDDDDNGWVRTVEMLTFDHEEINGCNQSFEAVALTGQAQIVTWTRSDGHGRLHVKQRIILISQGVGQTSGASYYLVDITRNTTIAGDPFPFFFIERRKSRLIGAGVPDQTLQYKTILRINAQGEVTTDINDFKQHCGQ